MGSVTIRSVDSMVIGSSYRTNHPPDIALTVESAAQNGVAESESGPDRAIKRRETGSPGGTSYGRRAPSINRTETHRDFAGPFYALRPQGLRGQNGIVDGRCKYGRDGRQDVYSCQEDHR